MFPGFQTTDFAAYEPRKWKSNVFNRERLEVKQKLLALVEGAGLTGGDGAPLALEASVEHPALWNHKQVEAQHVYFSRNEGARKELDAIINRGKSLASIIDDPTPQRNHVFLAVSIANEALEVSCRLHPDAKVDRENLERKCEDHFERERLLRLVGQLDERSRVGVTPQLVPVRELADEKLGEILRALSQPAPAMQLPGAPQRLLYIGRAIPRDEVLAAGSSIVETTRSSLAALLEVYRFIAWSRDNDFLSMRDQLQKERAQKRQRGLAKNDTVRIVRGMFAGKQGVVQEIDGKGALRVLVGKVAVKVDAEDVLKQ